MSTGMEAALVLALRVVGVGVGNTAVVAAAAGIHHSNPEVDIGIHSAANILCCVQEVCSGLRHLDTQSTAGIGSMVA